MTVTTRTHPDGSVDESWRCELGAPDERKWGVALWRIDYRLGRRRRVFFQALGLSPVCDEPHTLDTLWARTRSAGYPLSLLRVWLVAQRVRALHRAYGLRLIEVRTGWGVRWRLPWRQDEGWRLYGD